MGANRQGGIRGIKNMAPGATRLSTSLNARPHVCPHHMCSRKAPTPLPAARYTNLTACSVTWGREEGGEACGVQRRPP